MKIFLYILTILISAALIIALDHFLFVKKKDTKTLVKNSFKIFFLIYLVNLCIIYNVWGYKNVFNANKQEYIFFLYYLLQAIAIGGIYLLGKFLINKFLVVEKKELTKKGGTIAIYVISIALFFIGVLAFISTAWEQTVYFKASPDQIFITMLTPITGTDPKIIISYVEWPALLSICLTYIFALVFYARVNVKLKLKDESKTIISEMASRITTICAGSAILISGLTYLIFGMQLDKIMISYTVESSFIKDNYINPGDVEIKVPEKKRNLIHIYLESVENSFFTSENGGAMETNLMPNLLKLYEDGVNFSHLNKSEGYGGPLKTYGGSFSCGSMVNQFFGLPMRVPVVLGQYAQKDKFLPGAVGIGDILYQAGYNQTMMLGADADFGGLTNLFNDHGGFKIMDYKYALENGMLPKGYKVNWGFEDEKLYEFAKEEITRLSSTGQPFHFLMENADTHNPGFSFDGDEPIFGETDVPEDYGKTISFSEKHVVEFIRWIQQQPFYDNTTVVIIGDHNTMDGALFKEVDDNFIRTTYNLILNPEPSVLAHAKENRFYNRKWANFDMMPTIMAALGFNFKGDKLGLGTNLFSDLPTLYESMGYEEVTDLLICNSRFYNEEFAKKKRDYKGENLIK